MEDTLGAWMKSWTTSIMLCLNPCSNGRYSRSSIYHSTSGVISAVLILVLMEDTLGEPQALVNNPNYGLNPCSNGRYSWSSYVSCWSCSSCCVLILVLMEDTLGGLGA